MSKEREKRDKGRNDDHGQASQTKKETPQFGFKFWKEKEKGIVSTRLFSTDAEKITKDLVAKKNANKRSQIRKFYDEIVRIRDRVHSRPEDFEKMLPYLQLLKAKAAYALGRKHVDQAFKSFIDELIDQVKTPEDLEVGATLFEAVLGYHRMLRPKEE